jgi:CelD/BcsL family acetyltransferase involved in cellulose biosynthesis
MARMASAAWVGEVVPGDQALAGDLTAWQELLERSGAHPVFNGPDWLLAQRRANDSQGDQLWVLQVRAGKELHAWLPLVREAERPGPCLRRARLLGDGSFDSDYLEPLLNPDEHERSATLLAEALRRSRFANYAILRTLPSERPSVLSLLAALQRRGGPIRQERRWASRTALAGTFEAFLQGLKARMRSKVRQALRRADESGWRAESFKTGDDLGPWMEQLFALHQARWIAAGQSGAFADPRRCQLYQQAFQRFAERGIARIDRLVSAEGVLAIQAGFDAQGAYHQLQEGYLPELANQRPGVALRAIAMRSAIERGLRHYDFLGGQSSHKSDWGAEAIPLTTLTVPMGSWRGRMIVHALCRRQARAAVARESADADNPSAALASEGQERQAQPGGD